MIVPVMAISNVVLTRQIYPEETNGAHAHYREPVPLNQDQIVSNAHAHSRVSDQFVAFSSYVLIGVNYLKLSI